MPSPYISVNIIATEDDGAAEDENQYAKLNMTVTIYENGIFNTIVENDSSKILTMLTNLVRKIENGD